MYRCGLLTAPPTPAPGPAIGAGAAGSSLLSSVASQASGALPLQPLNATSTLTAPLHLATNPSSLRSLLQSHKAAAVLFAAPATRALCCIVHPAFGQLARDKNPEGLAFVKVDLVVGMGGMVAGEWGMSATPTVMYFSHGKKVAEVTGANIPEIRTELQLPAIQAISLKPILYSQVPDLNVAVTKFLSFLDGVPSPTLDKPGVAYLLRHIPQADPLFSGTGPLCSSDKVPLLPRRRAFPDARQARRSPPSPPAGSSPTRNGQVRNNRRRRRPADKHPARLVDHHRRARAGQRVLPLLDTSKSAVTDADAAQLTNILRDWSTTTAALAQALPRPSSSRSSTSGESPSSPRASPSSFPLLRHSQPGSTRSSPAHTPPALQLRGRSSSPPCVRPQTSLRTTSCPADCCLPPPPPPMRVGVKHLSHGSSRRSFRTTRPCGPLPAAWHLTLRRRSSALCGRVSRSARRSLAGEDQEWVIEMVSALVAALERESASEDVVHRLTASLALFVYLSPAYESQLADVLEVLQAKRVPLSKLEPGGCGETGVQRKEVRALVRELAEGLCP